MPLVADNSHYTIALDVRRAFVDVALRGFWTPDVINQFASDMQTLRSLFPKHGLVLGDHVSLFDALDADVQSQAVATVLTAMVNNPAVRTRRVAIVVDKTLLRLQVKRIGPSYAIFNNRTEAMAWLSGDIHHTK